MTIAAFSGASQVFTAAFTSSALTWSTRAQYSSALCPVASVTRSVIDLRGFQQITLKPGESREVVFQITPEALKHAEQLLRAGASD